MSGKRTWYLRYRDARGTQRQFRLADAQDLPLELARKRADELRGQIALGHDPAAQKAVLRCVPTFQEFATRYLDYVMHSKRSWKTDESLLRYMFNLALRWEVPGLTKNPTANVPLFEENNKRERYLTQDEARRLYEAVSKSENTMLAFIVPALIMTGARKRELLDAQWSHLDLTQRLWRIPISKSGKARHVPLSDGLIQLLAQIKDLQAGWPAPLNACPWVFANPATGKPYVSIFQAWNTARKRAGLPVGQLARHLNSPYDVPVLNALLNIIVAPRSSWAVRSSRCDSATCRQRARKSPKRPDAAC